MIRQHLLVAAWVLAVTLTTSAQEVDLRVRVIASKLRCPVCQNESVADSQSELSAQMRTLIRDKLAAGETEDQIVRYFVSRYGEWILLEPPRQGVLWFVWLAPAAALLGGAVLVIAYLRRSIRPHPHLTP
ncbi:MAG TPA: cytochrome c-type biogenesis protein CcmH [bacterium]|jgi:cytochrome c-type biogenesis protein CcmH|nr:cytochrome c-type biogenesis protein CcmH [bacterium]